MHKEYSDHVFFSLLSSTIWWNVNVKKLTSKNKYEYSDTVQDSSIILMLSIFLYE